MPLTVFFGSVPHELDVHQVLQRLSERDGIPIPKQFEDFPPEWRQEIRRDVKCPGCFITGAEIVQEAKSKTTGKPVRQAYFRFSSTPHHAVCDFAISENANSVPENKVDFGKTNSEFTRLIRRLVSAGIQENFFSQVTIRNMREWFFRKKSEGLFTVTLEPNLPAWMDQIWQHSPLYPSVSEDDLTNSIVNIPGFRFEDIARSMLLKKYSNVRDIIFNNRLWNLASVGDLARNNKDRVVFDPSLLKDYYSKTVLISEFVRNNYRPFLEIQKRAYSESHLHALAALLLFASAWEIKSALQLFSKIAIVAMGSVDERLGNVIGLNPFHKFDTWRKLKKIQDLNILVPDNLNFSVELEDKTKELQQKFGNTLI